MIKRSRRATIYSRVSTDKQTTENQERELREIAERSGWQVVETYRDVGISGAKGRDRRPAFDALCKDAMRRRLTWSWSGRSTGWAWPRTSREIAAGFQIVDIGRGSRPGRDDLGVIEIPRSA